ASLPASPRRYDLKAGLAEIAGAGGRVRIREFDSFSGQFISASDLTIPPYGFHPGIRSLDLVEIEVIEGDARVIAFGSNTTYPTGEFFYVPSVASPLEQREVFAPATDGLLASNCPPCERWRTDVWTTALPAVVFPFDVRALFVNGSLDRSADVRLFPPSRAPRTTRYHEMIVGELRRATVPPWTDISLGLLRLTLPPHVVASSRTHLGVLGAFASPLSRSELPAGGGSVLHVEDHATLRTYLGVANLGSVRVDLAIVLYEGSGRELGRRAISLEPLQLVHLPAGSIARSEVRNGRASLEFSGDAPLLFYGSVIDGRTGDSIYVPAQ
ncbi:MAG TPA: hypothetical protein VFL80_10015, partial [Thermoanaerobaculia bacterium]|nr:hypothetical protein [Thermoanaerobaculia bacterium]